MRPSPEDEDLAGQFQNFDLGSSAPAPDPTPAPAPSNTRPVTPQVEYPDLSSRVDPGSGPVPVPGPGPVPPNPAAPSPPRPRNLFTNPERCPECYHTLGTGNPRAQKRYLFRECGDIICGKCIFMYSAGSPGALSCPRHAASTGHQAIDYTPCQRSPHQCAHHPGRRVGSEGVKIAVYECNHAFCAGCIATHVSFDRCPAPVCNLPS